MGAETLGEFDVVVIGTGPGGEGAAMQAAKQGQRVAVVERQEKLGGACTHSGTIPSKSLRYMIFRMTDTNTNPVFRAAGASLHLAFPELRQAARTVIQRQVDMRSSFYERNHVPVVHGHARFVDPHTLDVESPTGRTQRLRAGAFILAVGSRPYRPANVDFTHRRIFDSDTILNLDFTPQSITIYGAGVVGCEYTTMFRNLNCKVNLVNTRSKLLEFLDDEIIDALAYHMRDRGVLIRHNETFSRIEADDDGVICSLESGKQLRTDILLWANGRTGNTQDIGLENVGLTANSRGQLEVNQDFQTAVPHVYAVGDVIGFPSLAATSSEQGRLAACCAFDEGCRTMGDLLPIGIYTIPEISFVGKTEEELTSAAIPYEIGVARYRELARGHIVGDTTGVLKLLVSAVDRTILGVHVFGQSATELVHIGQSVMALNGTVDYLVDAVFNYPTLSEAYKVAALDATNKMRAVTRIGEGRIAA